MGGGWLRVPDVPRHPTIPDPARGRPSLVPRPPRGGVEDAQGAADEGSGRGGPARAARGPRSRDESADGRVARAGALPPAAARGRRLS